jgi:hypothetical protein
MNKFKTDTVYRSLFKDISYYLILDQEFDDPDNAPYLCYGFYIRDIGRSSIVINDHVSETMLSDQLLSDYDYKLIIELLFNKRTVINVMGEYK